MFKRSVLLALLAGAVLVALAALPAAASAAFGINGYSLTPSSTQAGGHPTTTFQFNRTGTDGEDLRDMRIDLPPGLLANPEAANPKCTATQFNADTCSDASRVGTLSYKYRVSGLIDVTVPGAMYVLEPDATDVATIGFVLRPQRYCLFIFCAVPQKIFQKSSFKLRSFDNPGLSLANANAQRSVTTSIPLIFISPSFTSDVTLNSVKIVAQARAGKTQAGPYFMVNTTNCDPAVSTATITSYQDVVATATSSFTPTGCDQVPFNPTFDFQPSDKTGGSTATSVFKMNLPTTDAPIQNAAPKSLDITFPAGSAPDITKLSEWVGKPRCATADLEANTCPSGSIVGLSSASSTFLPPSLNGGVFLTGDVGLKIDLGIRLVGPRGTGLIVRLTLGLRVNSAGASEVYATFENGPQLPYAQFVLGLIPLYINPQQCGPAVTKVKATGWNGAVVERTATYDVINCSPPETTITAGPSGPTVVNPPTFAFTASIPGSKFFCKIDAAAEVPCNGGTYTPPLLTSGPHTFSVAAQNGPARDATPATRAFTIQNPGPTLTGSFTVSTSQAAAHPDLVSQLSIAGGGQIRSAQLTLPRGFQASLAAVPLCTNAQATAGACAASSRVGSVAITVSTASGPVSGTGDAYLTEAPTSADAGGLAFKVPLGTLGTLIVRGGQSTIDNTNRQQLNIRDIPQSLGGTAIAVSQLRVSLSGANALLTNASNCAAASTFSASVTAPDGSISAPVTSPYQATGCASVPFDPTVTQSFPSPPQAGGETGITVDTNLPANNGTLRSLAVREPVSFAPNFPAFGAARDRCPGGAAALGQLFDVSACPAAAVVGTMTINTPLLPGPLVGTVYLVNKTPIPWFGVAFDQPGVTLRLTGVTEFVDTVPGCTGCTQQISSTFSDLPDTPLTHVKFDLTRPDRNTSLGLISSKLLAVVDPGDPDCRPNDAGSWTAVSWTGAERSGTQAIPIGGC